MKIKRFGTISVTDDQLDIKGFRFEIDPKWTEINNKDAMDQHALISIIGYLIDLLVEREIVLDRTTH